MLVAMSDIPVYTIHLPQYRVDAEPDDRAIGKILDDKIKELFLGQALVVRGIASSEHPGKSIDDLIEIIKQSGTDRYDPKRAGDRYENIEGKRIDFFGFPAMISPDTELFYQMFWGFYHSAKAIHGKPVRIDIVIIYDAAEVQQVVHQYEGRDEIKNDGFIFKFPENRQHAVKAVFQLTG